MAWEAIVARSRSSQAFAAELSATRRVIQGKPKGFMAESLNKLEGLNMRMKKKYKFLAAGDFKKVFGDVDPKENLMNIPVTKVRNELGELTSGYVLGDGSPWRSLCVEWNTGTRMNMELLASSDMIRKDQARDMQRWSTEKMDLQPTVVVDGKLAPTVEEVRARVAAFKKQQAEKAAQAAQAPTVREASQSGQHVQQAALQEESETESVESSEELDLAKKLEASHAPGGAKAKGKGKGKSSKKGQSKRGRPSSAGAPCTPTTKNARLSVAGPAGSVLSAASAGLALSDAGDGVSHKLGAGVQLQGQREHRKQAALQCRRKRRSRHRRKSICSW